MSAKKYGVAIKFGRRVDLSIAWEGYREPVGKATLDVWFRCKDFDLDGMPDDARESLMRQVCELILTELCGDKATVTLGFEKADE